MKRSTILLVLFAIACALPSKTQTPVPQKIQPLQVKACVQSPGADYATPVEPCSFDNPVTSGDMVVAAGVYGCDYSVWPPNCNTISDALWDTFQIAEVLNFYNGQPLWYALNAKGGMDTVYFRTANVAIIAEYPPSTGLDDADFGTYGAQNYDCPQGGNCPLAWTLPVKTIESCELLISWLNSGTATSTGLAGPNFTVRAIAKNGGLWLEDSTTTTPGLYIASMSDSHTFGHWMEGVAAFKMGGCK